MTSLTEMTMIGSFSLEPSMGTTTFIMTTYMDWLRRNALKGNIFLPLMAHLNIHDPIYQSKGRKQEKVAALKLSLNVPVAVVISR